MPTFKSRLNTEEMTGLPYSELVRQSLTSAGNNSRDLRVALPEVDLIMYMVLFDDSPVFQDVIASQMVVTWSASIMKLAISKYEDIFLGDPGGLYDRMISALGIILDRACVTGDRRPAVEVVDSRVLHFVEWWSCGISGRKPEDIRAICEAVFTLLISAPTQAEMASQLKRISIRMEGRRGIDPEIVRTWKNAYESSVRRGYHAATDSGPVCAGLGCGSTAPAEMTCSRCMCTCYCSKECQKSDWKLHKPYCKKTITNSNSPHPTSK